MGILRYAAPFQIPEPHTAPEKEVGINTEEVPPPAGHQSLQDITWSSAGPRGGGTSWPPPARCDQIQVQRRRLGRSSGTHTGEDCGKPKLVEEDNFGGYNRRMEPMVAGYPEWEHSKKIFPHCTIPARLTMGPPWLLEFAILHRAWIPSQATYIASPRIQQSIVYPLPPLWCSEDCRACTAFDNIRASLIRTTGINALNS